MEVNLPCSRISFCSLRWDSQRPVLLMKTEAKKTLSTLPFSMSFSTSSPSVVPSLFAVHGVVESFLVAFHIHWQIQLDVDLDFTNPIPRRQGISICLLYYLYLLPPLVQFLFIYMHEFSWELCSINSGLLPSFLGSLLLGMHFFLKLWAGNLWISTSSCGTLFSPGLYPLDSSMQTPRQAEICSPEIKCYYLVPSS